MGDEDAVADQLKTLLDSGIDELLLSNLAIERDRRRSDSRLLHVIATL
jgi:hypothetical protein